MKWKRALNFPFRVHVNSDVSHASPFVMPLLHSRDQICTPACMQSRMYKRLPCYLCEGRIRRLFLRSALFLVRPGVIHCARITPIAPPPLSLSLFLSFFPRFRKRNSSTRFYTRLSRKIPQRRAQQGKKRRFRCCARHAAHPPICKTITPRTKILAWYLRESTEIIAAGKKGKSRAVDCHRLCEESEKSASEKQR